MRRILAAALFLLAGAQPASAGLLLLFAGPSSSPGVVGPDLPNTNIPVASVLADTDDVHEPAANTDAVITYAAVGGMQHVIGGIGWSYSAGPGLDDTITVEDGAGNIVFRQYVTAGGPGSIFFDPAKRGSTGRAMIVTLTAAGAGVTGKVSILNHWVTFP